MSIPVKRVFINTMKASNGVFFYVTIVNENNKSMTPYSSQHLDRAIHTADGYSYLFGLEPEKFLPSEYVNQETIDKAYEEVEMMEHLNEKYKS
jgi:hypothetical protein